MRSANDGTGRRSGAAVLAIALLLLGACFDGTFPDDPRRRPPPESPSRRPDGGFFILPDGGTVDPVAICQKLGELQCEGLLACGLVTANDAGMGACEAWLATVGCGPYSWTARVSAGTIAVDRDAAEQCAASLMSVECNALSEPSAFPCAPFLLPNRALGASCYGGPFDECRDGICRGASCPRACRAPGIAGEVCGADEECAAGLHCAIVSSGGLGACAAAGALGEPCGAGYRCEDALHCGAKDTCETRRPIGAPCEGDACVREAYCDLSGEQGGMCAASRLEGEPCEGDLECIDGTFCDDFDGRCASRATLPGGSPCTLRQTCAFGLSCVGASTNRKGLCGVPNSEDAACLHGSDCATFLSCMPGDAGRSVCSRRQGLGGACDEDRDCTLDARCIDGSCQPLTLPGGDCSARPCLFGACASEDGGARCIGLGAPSASCSGDPDCGSGQCVDGRCLAVCAP